MSTEGKKYSIAPFLINVSEEGRARAAKIIDTALDRHGVNIGDLVRNLTLPSFVPDKADAPGLGIVIEGPPNTGKGYVAVAISSMLDKCGFTDVICDIDETDEVMTEILGKVLSQEVPQILGTPITIRTADRKRAAPVPEAANDSGKMRMYLYINDLAKRVNEVFVAAPNSSALLAIGAGVGVMVHTTNDPLDVLCAEFRLSSSFNFDRVELILSTNSRGQKSVVEHIVLECRDPSCQKDYQDVLVKVACDHLARKPDASWQLIDAGYVAVV
jgi:hypothetical protein